jgi:hypothetical protein
MRDNENMQHPLRPYRLEQYTILQILYFYIFIQLQNVSRGKYKSNQRKYIEVLNINTFIFYTSIVYKVLRMLFVVVLFQPWSVYYVVWICEIHYKCTKLYNIQSEIYFNWRECLSLVKLLMKKNSNLFSAIRMTEHIYNELHQVICQYGIQRENNVLLSK